MDNADAHRLMILDCGMWVYGCTLSEVTAVDDKAVNDTFCNSIVHR